MLKKTPVDQEADREVIHHVEDHRQPIHHVATTHPNEAVEVAPDHIPEVDQCLSRELTRIPS